MAEWRSVLEVWWGWLILVSWKKGMGKLLV